MRPSLLLLALLLALPGEMRAEGGTQDGPQPVSFAAALQLADAHPRAVGALQAVKTKRSIDAAISPFVGNPQAGAQVGYRFAGPLERGVEGELSLAQPFNLAGLSGLRREGARREEEELAARARDARLGARLEAAHAWCSLWTAEQALQNAQSELQLAEQFARTVGRAARGGEMIEVEVNEAQAYLAEARLRVLSAEGDLFEAGIAFSRALGTAPRAARTQGPLPQVSSPPHELREALFEKLDALPVVEAQRRAVEAQRMRERELVASHGTEALFGVLGEHDQAVGARALATAVVTLPTFDRGERDRGTAAAEVQRLEGELGAAQAEARGLLTLTLHEIDHTQEVLEQVETKALPAAEEALRLRERLLQLGEGRVLDVLLAKRQAVAMRTSLAQARADRAWAGARLALLAGEMGVSVVSREGP